MKVKVGVFSATRAEYGLLYNVMREVDLRSKLELQTYISGTHLSNEFEETYKDIEADGFEITAFVEMSLSTETPLNMADSMSECLKNMTEKLNLFKPDILIILGDRYESFMACQAALISKIPVAHIHGGEITEGAMDESFRHAITKMSHFHFVAAEEFKERVLQLGENPNNVWVTGALGIDNIRNLNPVKKEDLEGMLGISLKKPIYLMTYHPVTLDDFNSTQELQNLLSVVFDLKGTLIITGTNIDPGSVDIKSTYKEFLNKQHKDLDVHFFNNLGFRNYLSLMLISDIVIGNSSSGIIEAPAIGVSTVDIGDRQKGRPRATSILHTDKNKKNIKKTIKLALSKEHQVKSKNQDLPYGGGDVAKNIVDVIINLSLNEAIKKPFYDV